MQNAAALLEKLPYKIVRTYNLENHVIPAVLGSVQVESLIVGVTNEHVNMISSAVAVADSVVGFIISEAGEHLERVTAIAIGNEPNEPASYVPPAVVLSALANFRAALAKRPEAAHIRLTVPMTGGVITLSYPPEAAIVDPTWVDVLRDVDVVSINWFPYFVAKSEPAMPIGIALGTMPPPWHYPPDAARTSVWDPAHADPTFGLHEARSLLDIMLHASKFALHRAGLPPDNLMVGETGWPSGGSWVATLPNARTFYENCLTGRMRSLINNDVTIILFELMDEALKPGNEDEHYWGQLTAGLEPKW